MRRILLRVMSFVVLHSLLSQVLADEVWTTEQLEVLESIDQLSAATGPGGGGADSYSAVLAEGFSRWTTGSDLINGKNAWVEGVRDWFDDGWRVADRDQTIVQIAINGDHAFVRRVVRETYVGPTGERTFSEAGLAETWVRSDGGWLLFWVNADVMENP